MTSKEKIREVLDKMTDGWDEMTQDNFFDIKEKSINQALQKILKIISLSDEV